MEQKLSNLKIKSELKNVFEVEDSAGEIKRYFKIHRKPYMVKDKEYFGYSVFGKARGADIECNFMQIDRQSYINLEKLYNDGSNVFLVVEDGRMKDDLGDIKEYFKAYAASIDEDIVDSIPLKFKSPTDKAVLEMLIKRIDRQE